MNKLITKFYSKELYKVFSVSGFRIFIQLLVGFLTSKALAIFVGISGMGIIGLVRNVISFMGEFLLFGTQNGIVKNLASQKNIKDEEKFLVTLFWFYFSISLIISILFVSFFKTINHIFFIDKITNFWIVFLFAICIPFQAISLFFNSVLNGKSKYKSVATIGMYSSIASLLISVLLMRFYRLEGALIGLIFTSIITFIISSFFFSKLYPLAIFIKHFKFNSKVIYPLLNYSLMSLVSIVISFSFSYYIRIEIIKKFTLEYAGYYEAIQRISGFYMLFINTFITFYYLPELAKCSSNKEIKKLTKEYYKNIIPIFSIGLLILLIGVDYIIPFFYNQKFLVISPYVKYQVLLDFIKALYLIIGVRFYAFGKTKGFLMTEIFSFAINFLFFTIAIYLFDFKGVWYGQILSSLIYFLLLIIVFNRYFNKNYLFHYEG